MHLNSEKVYYDFLIESATTRDKKTLQLRTEHMGCLMYLKKRNSS